MLYILHYESWEMLWIKLVLRGILGICLIKFKTIKLLSKYA